MSEQADSGAAHPSTRTHISAEQHLTSCCSATGVMDSTPHHSSAFGHTSREAGRWAEAFQKNVLAHHEAGHLSEPQPSRRPAPYSATTTKTTTTTTTATTANTTTSSSSAHSSPASWSQSLSAHTSPHPHSGQGGDTPAVAPVTLPRTVTAVAVHPPLSRGSKRAALSPGSTARSASLPSTSSAGSHTAMAVSGGNAAVPIRFNSDQESHAAPLPLPAQPLSSGAMYGTASAHSTPIRLPLHPISAAQPGGPPPPPPVASHIYTTPHARCTASHTKAKPLSQLQVQCQRGNGAAHGATNSPPASAATPHIPNAYSSSPFFQRVKETATSPPPHAPGDEDDDDEAVPSAAHTTHHTPHANTNEEDSSLLQEVTPITNGGGSWRHDSQLLSQPRETAGPAAQKGGEGGAAAATMSDDYFSTFQRIVHEGDAHRKGSTGSTGAGLSMGVSQLHPPPPPPPAALAAAAAAAGPAAQPLHAYDLVHGVSAAESALWAASGFTQHPSPYHQALYFPPGYTQTSGAAQSKPLCGPFTSPYTTPGDVTRLSASPGGLSGSHNATGDITYPQSGMISGMMQSAMMPAPRTGVAAVGAAAAFTQQPSQHIRESAGGYSPYLNGSQHVAEASKGASPPGFVSQQHRSLDTRSPVTSQLYSAVSQRGDGNTLSAGQVPTVSGTTATTTAAIASGLSGVALEKQLLHASKEELVQILLELGSCNTEAARFIDAKAFFFAFRHEHSRVPTPARTTHAATAIATINSSSADPCTWEGGDCRERQAKVPQQSRGDGGSCGKPPSSLTGGDTASSNRSIARCIFPAEAVDDEDADDDAGHPGRRTETKAQRTGTQVIPQRRVRPEERDFCEGVHPCLRWYGACRNATSCAYASLPRNLCLNWVRGACMAHTECSGVHRLPEPCPPELQKIYMLNHGLSRSDAPQTFRALSVASLPAAAASRAQWRDAGSASAEKVIPAFVRRGAAGNHVGIVDDAAVSQDSSTLHTPRDQSLHKDAIVGGDSTPHRHPNGRPECSDEAATATAAVAANTKPCLWSAVDVLLNNGEERADACVDNTAPSLRSMRRGSAASPMGSSCSTLEDRAASDAVSRCLREDFDDAAGSPTLPMNVVKAFDKVVCGGRRSPVVLPVCEAKEPLQILPLRSVAAEAHEAEEKERDDFGDFSAPAAGTRTRVQSPAYT